MIVRGGFGKKNLSLGAVMGRIRPFRGMNKTS